MWIKGYVHKDIDEAFFANVQIVSKWVSDHRAGIHIGYMEFTDGTYAEIFRHPGGTYYGYVVVNNIK